jgi:hypothetical protein
MKKGDYHFVEDEDGAVWAEPSIKDMAIQMQSAMKKSKEQKKQYYLLIIQRQSKYILV